jgi:CDP-paratose 2-epimerase
LAYLGFGGWGFQVRDALHPRDLLPLLRKQMAPGAAAPSRVVNLGGGVANAMSLAELSMWCRERFGSHEVAAIPENRRFDIPWLVMDATLAGDIWDWRPQTPLLAILDEIARHAEQHPHWLEVSGLP